MSRVVRSPERARLRVLGLLETKERAEATVFVVEDATCPGERALLQAAARGGLVMDVALLLGQAGLFLRYRTAMKTKRRIFITDQFAVAHPDFSDAVERAASAEGSQWRTRRGDVADSKANEAVLVTGQAAGQATGTMNKQQFLNLVAKLDFGSCGHWHSDSRAKAPEGA